ncbi:MAG: response regulator [Pseudomonadota bacterium]
MDQSDNRPRILIVDDEPSNLRILAAALDEEYDLVVCTNGDEALSLACSEPAPDLILLDVLMPDLNGFEVCSRLKADPATELIPVIFVTMIDDHINEERGFTVGAVDYVYKPIRSTLVRARVRVHIRLKQHREFLEQLVLKQTDELDTARKEAEVLLEQLVEDQTIVNPNRP